MPTATEMIYRKLKEKKDETTKKRNEELAQKYGNTEVEDPDLGIILGESEHYVEYTRDGKVRNISIFLNK